MTDENRSEEKTPGKKYPKASDAELPAASESGPAEASQETRDSDKAIQGIAAFPMLGKDDSQAWLPRPYPQLLRGPGFQWWQPLISAAIVMAGLLVIGIVISVGGQVQHGNGIGEAVPPTAHEGFPVAFLWFLLGNLCIGAIILVVLAATRWGYGWQPRWVLSVIGTIRWNWLLMSTAVAAVILGLGSLLLYMNSPFTKHSPSWGWEFISFLVLIIPLQAVAEEMLFRGWLTQAIGSLARNARTGAVIAALISSVAFAAMHQAGGMQSFLSRMAFGALLSGLVWISGGLEAAMAVHVVYNMVWYAVVVAAMRVPRFDMPPLGGYEMGIVLVALTAAVLWWLARREVAAERLQTAFHPPVRAWQAG